MTARKSHKASFLSAIKIIGGLLLLLFLSNAAFGQNTKGDKPQGNQRQVRGTKAKSVKRKEKGKTKDIAGRRLRTTDRSSASRANSSFRQPSPYSGRRKSTGDRASGPRGRTFSNSPRESRTKAWTGDVSGHRIRTVKPSRSGVARNNVYPQSGPYVNNPSKKPRIPDSRKMIGRTANGKRVVNRSPQQKQRAWKGNLRGGPIVSFSSSGSVRNVYPQKNRYSRYTGKVLNRKDKPYSNSGIAAKNLRLSDPGPRGRKFSIYPRSISSLFVKRGKRNVYWGKFSKGERAFNGDISGGPLRMRNFKSTPAGLVGRDTLKMFGRRPGGDRAYKGKRGGFISATPRGNRAWIGDLAGRGIRSPKKGVTNEVAGRFVFPRKMSISGKVNRAGRFKANGGGSVSSRRRDNRPITPRAPGIGASGIAKGMARTKGRKPLKGGGSISGGGWNNRGQAIDPRSPGQSSIRAGRFQGNIKGKRPEKGGGSVSGRLWNNNRQPIDPREPGQGSIRAGRFQGNIKGGRPEKGGGSISGRLWNNKGQPIDPREPGQGSIRAGRFAGNMKAKRPEKGGGSISGKLWNNNEKPIQVRTPLAEDAKAANYSGKMKLRRGYTQNDKAHDKSILKHRPNENAYLADGLQIKVKRGKYEKKPEAADNAMLGIGPKESTVRAGKYGGNIKMARNYKHNPVSHKDALDGVPPTKSSIKASEYSRSLRMTWSYKHNPSSADAALKVRDPKSEWQRATTFAGRTRLTRSYKHNPHSADAALKGLAPNKAYAKIGNYQGNIKMNKYNDKRLHPDAKFAHTHRDNVKGERTILMDVKLLWARLFKKSETQPENLKDKGHRPRYDKGEKGMWADDPRYTKKQKAEQ